MFNSVDPFMMMAFYESDYSPSEEPTITFEDIDVDFSKIKKNIRLRKAISRALSLRVWYKHPLQEAHDEINEVIIILKND